MNWCNGLRKAICTSLCICEFMGLWVYGFVAMWLCGFVGLWLCGVVGFDTQHLFGVTGEKNGVSHDSALRRNYLNKKQFSKIR